jgi:cyclopropane-fatty-acyl-phospholipid synthase
MWYTGLLEKNMIPDSLLRMGIRKLLRQRLREEKKQDTASQQEALMNFIEVLKKSPIAIHVSDANQQHYEVPTEFYRFCLGSHLKYSSGYWNKGVKSLSTAEKDMLELSCKRAGLEDGQDVLELGCGWGSLSLYMAEKYPRSYFTVISNSKTQKQFIDDKAAEKEINNLDVITADINDFSIEKKFDRVISVEMFEHMRNYRLLIHKIASFLKPEGKLFVHIFCHIKYAYPFDIKDESDWMSKYFFTGGIMPSDQLLLYFNEDMHVEDHWHVSGLHYSKTAEAWLANMDGHKKEILPLFAKSYGGENAIRWWVYWRIFFMACSELWKFNEGEEWIVSHYLFGKK